MAETSKMLPLGTIAPDFKLLDTVTNKTMSLSELKSTKATVIMFICNHCPYVKYIQAKFTEIADQYQKKGLHFIAISSNDIENYPDDSPEKMHEEALAHGYNFPYLYDETQDVAKAYQAACTPEFYVFDSEMKCVYRGRLDDSTPRNNKPVTGKDLTDALDNVVAGKAVDANQMPSIGCGIKWKK